MWFDSDPAAVAVEARDGALTFGELADAEPATGELTAEPTTSFAAGILAAIAAGTGVVLVDPRWSAEERSRLAAAPDRGVLLHTSGTTGRPRPVVLTPENLLASARATNEALRLGVGDSWLAPLPLSHVAGLMVLVRCAVAGATAVLGPASLTRATHVSLVPTQLKRLLDAGVDGRPGTVVLGGAAAERALLERAAAAGVPVRVAYGLTQTSAQVTLSEPGDLDTAGRPLPGARIEIAPDGEVVVRGPMVAGGEVRTGDLGELDAEGRLRLSGRRDDLIVTGGENVMPAEIEAVLLCHPAVADAAVVGRPDPEWGSAVTALVVPADGTAPDPQELREHCRGSLAGFKIPKRIEFVEALPRTASGKLLRRLL